MTDTKTRGLVALHNLGMSLDFGLDLPKGTPGFPYDQTPAEYLVERLEALSREACPPINRAWQAAGEQEVRPVRPTEPSMGEIAARVWSARNVRTKS